MNAVTVATHTRVRGSRGRSPVLLVATGPVGEVPEQPGELFGRCPTSREALLEPSACGEPVLMVGGTEAGLNAALVLTESGAPDDARA